MPFALTPERDRELSEILSRYPNKMAACIPTLHLCQDQHGWVSDEVVDFVSNKLDLPPAHVKGVVTFYTLFNQHPVGKHQVWVCRTLPCALRGAGDVLRQCEKKLGIKPGETTADGKVTLRTAECLASCGTAPMMQVDRDYHENLSSADVDRILDGLLKDKPVAAKYAPPMPAPAPIPGPVTGAGIAGAGANIGGAASAAANLKGTMLGLGSKAPPAASPAAGSVKPPGGSVPPPPLPVRAQSTRPPASNPSGAPPSPPKPPSPPSPPKAEDAKSDEKADEKKSES